VFGAGGDRDNSKRQLMGQAVSNFADWCVLTSDNPRTEDPEKIIADVAVGIDDQQIDCAIIADRSEAIDYAVAGLEEGEVLLVAGKGHETYQEINGVRSDFDDRLKIVEANQCLA
jgi:UDP-N-acetylmuramoyl-L-alanyl-D-glutamate--2,6-diaminopimelate ligase